MNTASTESLRPQSAIQRALGPEFGRLHPRIASQYSLCSLDGQANIGQGIMEEIWRGPFYTWPFLRLGSLRRIVFGEIGRQVPFTVRNYAYVDGFGRETLTWTREFAFAEPRRFDETLIYCERRRRAVVYAGTHQHLAVELSDWVDVDGSLCLRTGVQRLYLGLLGLRFPRLLSGTADVRESFDDGAGRFTIDVRIASRIWGPIFGYRGWFTLGRVACATSDIPADVRPIREERRE